MYLHPYEPIESIDFDYAIVDLNINSDYYYDLKDQLISLAPNYAKKTEHIFPYLLRLNSVDRNLIQEIFENDDNTIKEGGNPFFLFIFKSILVREPDIVQHLKERIIYNYEGKKYLYRFFDPKIWMLLNFFKSPDFIKLNCYFKEIKVSFCKKNIYLKNVLPVIEARNNDFIDFNLLESIGVNNRVIGLLKYNLDDFKKYFEKVSEIFEKISLLSGKSIANKNDKVAIVYHMELLGTQYIETNFFDKLSKSRKGYEQSSKEILSLSWDAVFRENKIVDEKIKNKVMYGY